MPIPHNPKYSLVNSTESELEQIRNNILNKPKITSLFFKELGKEFLSNFLEFGKNIWKEKFNVTREKYLSLNLGVSIPKNELGFYKFICKEYLFLQQEPARCFISIYQEGNIDLGEIEQNIRQYKLKKDKNEAERFSISVEEFRANEELWKHLIAINEEAKEEVVYFLTSHKIIEATVDKAKRLPDTSASKDDMFFYTLSEAIDPPIFRYSYYHSEDLYKIEKEFGIHIRFLFLTNSERTDLKEDYLYNKPKFHEKLDQYIEDEKILSEISTCICSNYFLHKRRYILSKALEAFQSHDYLTFIYLSIFQIEGIFDDWRKVTGHKPKEFERSSLTQKIKDVWKYPKKISTLYAYEYYCFVFPVLRNQLAHGKQIDDNLEITAKLVLLDLYYPCYGLSENQDPSTINQLIQILKDIKNLTLDQGQNFFKEFSSKSNLLYLKILIYCILTRVCEEKLEDFPEFNATIEFIESLIKEEHFFLFIHRSLHLYKTDEFNIYDEIEMLVHKLKKEIILENSRISKLRSEILKITNQGKKARKNDEKIEKLIDKFQKETTLETSKISELSEILKITNQENKRSQTDHEAEENPTEVNYCEIGENIKDALRSIEL